MRSGAWKRMNAVHGLLSRCSAALSLLHTEASSVAYDEAQVFDRRQRLHIAGARADLDTQAPWLLLKRQLKF